MQATCCPIAMCEDSECLQLTEREAQICLTVCTSEEPVAFSTVKKALGFHQEIISRTLRRLVLYGAIERVSGKYRRKVGQ